MTGSGSEDNHMTAKMSIIQVCVLSLFLAVTAAEKSPVLIWSSEIPLSEFPQSHLGQTVKTDQFDKDYLKPLTSQHNLVIFLQDKLTLEDFINHADVYNLDGDGGVFKNVKASLDEQFSVQLPAVTDPSKAIQALIGSFDGKVAKVDNPEDISSLPLDSNKKHIILVQLPNVVGNDEASAFKRNDEMIGKCMHHLHNKRDVKFSAVYTAEAVSNADEQAHVQRRLLAANENATGKFFMTPQTMMYVKSINITVVKMSEDANTPPTSITIPFLAKDSLTVAGVNMTNQTKMEDITMNLTNAQGDFVSMKMWIASTFHGEYQSMNGNITVKTSNQSAYDVELMPMDFKIQATKGFSYHCSKLRTSPLLKGYNNTNNNKVYVTVMGFQFEAFTNITSMRFSDNVWDCVEFFTTGIWMGILTTLVLIMILFFGVTMIADITTMDRFDDPKGKTITVTVNE